MTLILIVSIVEDEGECKVRNPTVFKLMTPHCLSELDIILRSFQFGKCRLDLTAHG